MRDNMYQESNTMLFKKPVHGALYMFDKGFQVFPVISNKKEPAVKDWQEWANKATKKLIEDYGTANPMSNWGVFASGSGLAIIDIDKKEDRDGYASIKNLIESNGKLPRTLSVVTPTGGKHIYYKGQIQNSANALGHGIDTRGRGGYVLAPGSRIDGRAYECTNDAPIVDIPAWVVKQLSEIKKEKTVVKEDTPVVEGARNETLASLAGTMREVGFDKDAILQALIVFNEKSVSPPLSLTELEHISFSISRYTPGEGQAKAAADFMDIPDEDSTFTANTIIESDLPVRRWVMRGRYISQFVSVIVSSGGVGKSTLCLLDAISIASGLELSGFDVNYPGPVWIYNTEDPRDEIKRRVVAMAKHHEVPLEKLDNLHLTSGRDKPLVLAKADKQGVAVNTKAIEYMVSYINKHKIELLLLDPFIKTHSVNENDNMQVDKVITALNKIAERTGVAIGVVHHDKKAGKNGPVQGDSERSRGASSLVSAARVAHTIDTMTEEVAKRFGIHPDKRRWYVRIDDAKQNMAAPASKATWYERKSIELLNGDSVGSLEIVDIKSKADESHKEQIDMQRKDAAYCLAQVMDFHDEISLKEAADILLTDPKHCHLFGTQLTSKDRAERVITSILKTRPYHLDKVFSIRNIPDKRPSKRCVCSERTVTDAFV
jgi:RecA-family ATPase